MACQRCDNGDVCITHAAVAIPGLGEDNRCRNCKGTGEADHGHYAPGVCSRCKGTGIEPPAVPVNSADGFCPECGTRIKIAFDAASGRWLCGPCYGRALNG